MTVIRLNKYLSQSGHCSRRAADELIQKKKVLINGIPSSELGIKIDPEKDEIRIKQGPIITRPKTALLLMLNKPKGYVCTKSDVHADKLVYELLPAQYQSLFSIGRLDKDSEGLLLFTNDGELANSMAHPRAKKEKIYQATIKGRLRESDIRKISTGLRMMEYKALPARARELSYDAEKQRSVVEVALTEGKKRQVREMFLALKHPVKKLIRISFGPYRLGNLELGQWRLVKIVEEKI
ncbi:MAG: pseudouridine synthase [bacterium]|nr:pseudouridine synthase [bacterium]